MQTPWIPSRLAASLHRSTPHPPWYGSGARSMARSNSQSRILCRKSWGVKWLKAENSSCVHLSYLDSTYPRVECWRCLWSQSLSRLQLVENEKKQVKAILPSNLFWHLLTNMSGLGYDFSWHLSWKNCSTVILQGYLDSTPCAISFLRTVSD